MSFQERRKFFEKREPEPAKVKEELSSRLPASRMLTSDRLSIFSTQKSENVQGRSSIQTPKNLSSDRLSIFSTQKSENVQGRSSIQTPKNLSSERIATFNRSAESQQKTSLTNAPQPSLTSSVQSRIKKFESFQETCERKVQPTLIKHENIVQKVLTYENFKKKISIEQIKTTQSNVPQILSSTEVSLPCEGEINLCEDEVLPVIKAELDEKIKVFEVESKEMLNDFNSDLNSGEKEKIVSLVEKRAQAGFVLQNYLSSAVEFYNSSEQEQQHQLKVQLIPNPCIKQEVDIIPPISIEEVRETRKILSTTQFSFEPEDPNAIFHVLKEIANQSGLDFVIRGENQPPISKDSTEKLTDFALTNEVITENSLFLLGSERPEHKIKGFTIKLDENYKEIMNDQKRKQDFAREAKLKLAEAFQVSPDQIVITSFGEGSTEIHFTVKELNPSVLTNMDSKMKSLFDSYKEIEVHASFMMMEVSASSFDPGWNRDFSIDYNCPEGEQRGGYEYYPPVGFMRYGLNVSEKFDDGDDTWLGYSNSPGEWAVAYHGTSANFVSKIISSPLKVGNNNYYGRGIYCSPKVEEAAAYARSSFSLETIDGSKEFIYVFMCRVNVSRPHYCNEDECNDEGECNEAENPDYTIHFTTCQDYWFVNLNNTNYENIRCYGILVKNQE